MRVRGPPPRVATLASLSPAISHLTTDRRSRDGDNRVSLIPTSNRNVTLQLKLFTFLRGAARKAGRPAVFSRLRNAAQHPGLLRFSSFHPRSRVCFFLSLSRAPTILCAVDILTACVLPAVLCKVELLKFCNSSRCK